VHRKPVESFLAKTLGSLALFMLNLRFVRSGKLSVLKELQDYFATGCKQDAPQGDIEQCVKDSIFERNESKPLNI
jgi:hypothetical protein